jgi:hypothetical protein
MSKAEVKKAWSKVADEISGLGLKLKLHLQEETAADDGEEMKAAFKRLGDAIEDTVEAAEKAAKDTAVRQDVRDTGTALIDALQATVDKAVAGVRSSLQ